MTNIEKLAEPVVVAFMLAESIAGIKDVDSNSSSVRTAVVFAINQALQAQREAHIEAIKQFAREGHAASAEAIIQAILNAQVQA